MKKMLIPLITALLVLGMFKLIAIYPDKAEVSIQEIFKAPENKPDK